MARVTALVFALWAALVAEGARAAVPDAYEAEYSEAVIAYNSGSQKEAIQILDRLIAKDPKVTEFYELKALNLKAMNRLPEAVKIYAELIQLKKKLGHPAKEAAPYQFEIAMAYDQGKRKPMAKRFFEESLKQGFNTDACQMYLGMYAFEASSWKEAESYFEKVADSKVRDLRPMGYFYLGQTYVKTGYATGATQSFLEARTQAQAIVDDGAASPASKEAAKQALDAANRALAPYSNSSWFGFASLINGYDSNVLTVPSSIVSSSETEGKRTVTSTLGVGLGWASPSVSTVQIVPSYQGSLNYNFNRNARSAEFISNTLSLYTTVHSLARTSYGLKLEGNYLHRNEVDTTTDKGTFKRFSRTGTVGPYFKHEIARRMPVQLEAFYLKKTYLQDEFVTDDQKRTGSGYELNALWSYGSGGLYFNPDAALSYESDDTKGTEYRAKVKTATLGNAFRFTDKWSARVELGYAISDYDVRTSGKRSDKTLTMAISASYVLSSKWTLLGGIDATKNSSNIDSTYSYDRLVITTGASFSFL